MSCISPSDVPIDTSGLNADRWHFKLNEPFNGHHVGALLEDGRTVEPVTGHTLRRIVGGMGSYMVGCVRVDGGERVDLGDVSWFEPPAPAESDDERAARAARELAEKTATDGKALADKAAAEEAAFEAELAAEAAKLSTPAAAPASVSPADAGVAVPSTDAEPATPKAKAKK